MRIPASREDVIGTAEILVERMKPACKKIQIAGSLRRKAAYVKDIEIVAQPILEPEENLFGEVVNHHSKLDPVLEELQHDGMVWLVPMKGGDRYKQFMVRKLGIKLDLFLVRPPAQWGLILAIRTGPALFSRRLVTWRSAGGFLPSHLHVKDGAIRQSDRSVIETPEERDVFEVLEMEYVEPSERR